MIFKVCSKPNQSTSLWNADFPFYTYAFSAVSLIGHSNCSMAQSTASKHHAGGRTSASSDQKPMDFFLKQSILSNYKNWYQGAIPIIGEKSQQKEQTGEDIRSAYYTCYLKGKETHRCKGRHIKRHVHIHSVTVSTISANHYYCKY